MASQETIELFRERKSSFESINPKFFYKEEIGKFSLKYFFEPIFIEITEQLERLEDFIPNISDFLLMNYLEALQKLDEFLREFRTHDDKYFIDNRSTIQLSVQFHFNPVLEAWAKVLPQLHDLEKKILLNQISEIIDLRINQQEESIVKNSKELLSKIEQTQINSEIKAKEIENLKIALEKELQDLDERFKPALINATLEKQRLGYSESEKKLLKERKIWYWILAINILLILAYTFILLFVNKSISIDFYSKVNDLKEISTNFKYFIIVIQIVLKAVIYSILFFILRYVIKNINALSHNIIIYSNKSNSLDIALGFIDRISVDARKEEILFQVSKEIFAQNKTGYLTKDDQVDMIFIKQVIDLVKSGK